MGILDRFRLDGKVALVTGGSRGLGLQIAEGLGEAGAAVAITARRQEGLREAEQRLRERGIRCLAVRCDVTDYDQVVAAVRRVVDELGGLDILVNNAGATWGAPFDEIPLDAWDKVIRTNIHGTFYMSREAAKVMIRQGRGGRIINIASIAGLRGSDPRVMQTLPYNTAKAGVINFTRDLAVKLAGHGITVNCIAPGFFPTKMTRGILQQYGELIRQHVPLGRLGGERDLQGAALLFASEAGAYITGQVLAVDGGMTAW
ncbi:MAG TPA: SDR family oxidoreductase [Thermaerobacter sp.]